MKTNCNGPCRVIYDYYALLYIHNFSRREVGGAAEEQIASEVPVIIPLQASQMYLSCDFGNKSFIF